MAKTPLTVDEIIGLLQRSSIPALLVEGSTDAAVYRKLEELIQKPGLDVFPCSGRDSLLKLFERRNEFAGRPNVFLADLDMWVLTGAPSQYGEIVFTRGYCIENDLIENSGVEGRYFNAKEHAIYEALVESLCFWFAFEAEQWTLTGQCRTDVPLARLIPKGTDLCPLYQSQRGITAPTPAMLNRVRGDYPRMVRGKQLLSALHRVLGSDKRTFRHTQGSILDYCLTTPSHPNLQRIIDEVRRKLLLAAPSRPSL